MLHIGSLIDSFSSNVAKNSQQQFTAILFITFLTCNSLKYHNPIIRPVQPCGVFSAFSRPACFSVFFQDSFSLCRFSSTLHWSCHNSGEWQPNGRLKPLSPVCLIAGGEALCGFEAGVCSLTDRGQRGQQPRTPLPLSSGS